MPSGLCEDTAGEAGALIGRMVRGDGRALEEMFAMWGPVFLGIAQRMLGDHQEALKVVRETFVRIWRSSADFDVHRAPPFVWAFAILRELCIQRLQRRRKATPNPQAAPSMAPSPEPCADPRVMPLADWQRLRSAWDALSPEELGCLKTAVFLGYASSALPEPPASHLKSCLRRALDKLRNPLSRYEL